MKGEGVENDSSHYRQDIHRDRQGSFTTTQPYFKLTGNKLARGQFSAMECMER
jgi:hypothetical protein